MSEENKQVPVKTLGPFNRALLSVAALTKGIAGIIKEDSKKSRLAFWAYAAAGAVIVPSVLVLGLLPGPNLPGVLIGLGAALGFVGTVKMLSLLGVSKWARERNKRHLHDVFNGEALIKRYDEYILPKENKPGEFYVHKRKLLAYTFNKASNDVDEVSPETLRQAGSFTRRRIVEPVVGFISSVFNYMTGKKPDDKPPENKPPPGPQP